MWARAYLLGCVALTVRCGHVVDVANGMKAEVDEYAHGVFRLRVREAGSTKYEVSDVVVEDALNRHDATQPFKSGPSSLTVAGDTARFTSTTPKGDIEINLNFANTLPATDPVEASIAFPSAQRLYGIPEHAVDMSLKYVKRGKRRGQGGGVNVRGFKCSNWGVFVKNVSFHTEIQSLTDS